MKNRILITVFVLTAVMANVPVMAQSPQTPPQAYNSNIKVSYVRIWDATAPESNPNTLMTRPLKDVRQATQYVDGLGRPIQTVIKQGSLVTGGTATDLVTATVFDDYGREQRQYLPFAANNTGSNPSISDGLFKSNPFQQQASFMQSQYGSQNETWFYAQTNFEASPLNRPLESFAPGNSWAGTSGQALEANRRSVKIKHWINTAIDSVRIWNVTNVTNNFGSYATPAGAPGIYPAGTLFKSVTVDEHGKQVIEFKTKAGLIILKKVQNTAADDTGTGKGHTGWLCTYYLYDDMNNLRCVVQPRGVELISSTWAIE